jgi:hypothetical protein
MFKKHLNDACLYIYYMLKRIIASDNSRYFTFSVSCGRYSSCSALKKK